MTNQKRYFMGYWGQSGMAGIVCPNCSNIQEPPEKHKYHFVEFNLGIGETEKKYSNCGAILYIKPYENKNK